MTELTARNAGVAERTGSRRPGFWRVFFLTLLGGIFGALAAALFGAVVGVVGVASPPLCSRAGCRRGTSGRIATIRVRYALGGVHVMELPLDPAPALTC